MTEDEIAQRKLQIELEPLEVEKQREANERRRIFLEEWRMNLELWEKKAASALQNQVAYGQIAIRNVLILNGGALIAVPTFAQLVKA